MFTLVETETDGQALVNLNNVTLIIPHGGNGVIICLNDGTKLIAKHSLDWWYNVVMARKSR